MKDIHLVVINPGSTSTKVALTKGYDLYATKTLYHDIDELSLCEYVPDQLNMRLKAIEKFLIEEKVCLSDLTAIVGRGGLLKPVSSGTYLVNERMLKDLYEGKRGHHASNLGGILAHSLALKAGVQAYIVDPPSVHEFEERARYSGLPELPRHSQLHALNIRRVALRVAQELKLTLEECNFIVVHLGGGISVCAMSKGRMVDVNNANHGGPFSPERAGGLPAGPLLCLCFSGDFSEEEMKRKIMGKAGLVGYLGTNDGREIEERIRAGDAKAKLVYQALGYQVIKEIGAMEGILPSVEALIITGGLAHSDQLVNQITSYVGYVAPIFRIPGENELLALAEGVTRVLQGVEALKNYE